MAALSAEQIARARKNQSAILQGLASVGQATVADALGVAESTVSRMKEKDIPDLAKLLAIAGLKVVPTTMRCFDPQKIGAILALAKAHLAEIETTEQLAWDDAE